MRLAVGNRLVQRFAGRQQVRLADELLERARPHAIGQRPPVLAAVGQPERLLIRVALAHLGSGYDCGVPITSTPAGGLNCSSDASKRTLRSLCENSSVTVWPSRSVTTMRCSR